MTLDNKLKCAHSQT